MVPTQRVTIEVRDDHTLRYEWKNLTEPGKNEGRLDAMWREPSRAEADRVKFHSEHGQWFVFAKGEPDRERDPMEGLRIMWSVDGWWFPTVDTTSGKFQDSFWIVRRTGP